MKKIASVLFALIAMAGFAAAQSASTGTVIGTITDPSGAVVPAATIELKDTATGVSRTAVTSSAGQYSFPGVQPGAYSVRATHAGFEEVIAPKVEADDF